MTERDAGQLGRGAVGDRIGPSGEPAQVRVVDDDELAVPAEMDVDLHEVEAERDGELHRSQGVLRRERARAAVTHGPRMLPREVHAALTFCSQGAAESASSRA